MEDPFERADVSGKVMLDGQSLPYGEINFRGERQKDSVELAQATLMIRDGAFKSNRAMRPGLGKNQVLIIAYEGAAPPPPDPNDESGNGPPEPKVLGYYATEVDVADEQPLEFSISKSELQKTPPK